MTTVLHPGLKVPESDSTRVFGIVNRTKQDIQTIINTPMRRNRDIERIQVQMPSLIQFIEDQQKKGIHTLVELGSGEGYFADDIQNKYNINIIRVDLYKPKYRRNIPKGGRNEIIMDIQDIKHFPQEIPGLYSKYALQYIHNAPDIMQDIYDRLLMGGEAYIQFPSGLRSDDLLAQIQQQNPETLEISYNTDRENPKYINSVMFKIKKTETPFNIPKYHSSNGHTFVNVATGEAQRNGELFYHYCSETNDPKREKLQNMKKNTIEQ